MRGEGQAIEEGFEDVKSTKKAAADATVGMGNAGGGGGADVNDGGADAVEAGDDGAGDSGGERPGSCRIPLGSSSCC